MSQDSRMVQFTKLSERLAKEQPWLTEKLASLKEKMPPKDFEEYIENLISLKMNEGALWLITKREMSRSILERNYLPQLKESFGADSVRIITQPW